MQPANLLAFYRTVADSSPVPILIYSVPVFTKYDIPSDMVIELAEHPNIIGIKESGGDADKIRQMVAGTRHIRRSATVTDTFGAVTLRMVHASQAPHSQASDDLVPVTALAAATTNNAGAGAPTRLIGPSSTKQSSSPAVHVLGTLKTRQKEVGFQVLAGSAQRLLPSLEAGAVGGILAFATPAPTACYEIYAAWKEGDHELARLKQERITKAAIRVASEFGIPGLKYALDLNGYYGGPPRLPLLPLTASQKVEVELLLSDIRN
jgi:dihydrodipicolinate synthase/N-acetylneuraminate lyase